MKRFLFLLPLTLLLLAGCKEKRYFTGVTGETWIVREKTWKGNPSGTVKAIGIGIGGGLVLFGLNYGEFLLKLKMGDAFHTSLAFLLVAGLIAGSIYLLKKG